MHLSELRAKKSGIESIAGRYGVTNIQVFGSVARGDADEASDIDLLVEMPEGSLLDLTRFKRELEDMLGCGVDLVEPAAIHHPKMRERIFAEATPL